MLVFDSIFRYVPIYPVSKNKMIPTSNFIAIAYYVDGQKMPGWHIKSWKWNSKSILQILIIWNHKPISQLFGVASTGIFHAPLYNVISGIRYPWINTMRRYRNCPKMSVCAPTHTDDSCFIPCPHYIEKKTIPHNMCMVLLSCIFLWLHYWGISLGMCPANERPRYIVTMSVISWTLT